MNFQERLAAKIKVFESNLAPRFRKIVEDDIQRLVNSNQEDSVLKTGNTAPEIELPDQNGKLVKSTEMLKKGPLVLTFYRGFWCAFCNVDLANLNHYVQEIADLGATMITLSPEQSKYSKKIIALQKLNFDILFDKTNSVAAEFGLKHQIGNELKELYLNGFNVNLKQYHGNDEWALPMPARFLIDQEGIIRYSESKADYRQRPDPDDLIAVLKKL